jgi:hypothetical protein
VHQSAYVQKVLEKFNMDKAYPSKTTMVVRSLEIKTGPFRPPDEGEETLGPQVPYLSVIGALMYLTNSTRPDIAFAMNLLARHSAAPTKRHWTRVKQILRYVNGTRDLGLFLKRGPSSDVVGYTNAIYQSNPWQITNRLCVLTQWNHYFMDIFQTNFGNYVHESF